MKSRLIPVLVLVLTAAASAARLTAQTAPPAPSALKVQKLADGVWAADPDKGANVGWFLLGDGVVVVDSGTDTATARDVLKQIAETTGVNPETAKSRLRYASAKLRQLLGDAAPD